MPVRTRLAPGRPHARRVDARPEAVAARSRTGLTEVADLSAYATWHCNDMVVDASGRAYIGNFGFDLDGGGDVVAAVIVRVDPDGAVSVAADGSASRTGP